MDDEITGSFRRTSSRNRKVASKMVAALASSDNRSQAAIARLEALENDNAGAEMVEINDDSDASLDDDEEKTVQEYKAENQAGKSTRERKEGPKNVHRAVTRSKSRSLASTRAILSEGCCGPPSSTSRRHFCTVCGFTANYTCVRCGMRFCSCRCQVIHTDTRCLKFVA